MIYVSSDWHGCDVQRIKELLASVDFCDSDFLFVLGDVIDRGEAGVELLKWLMEQPNIELLLGNHEDMMLACDWMFSEITDESLAALDGVKLRRLANWQSNGADVTIDAMRHESPESREAILEFLRDCPLYDEVEVGGRRFVLVHGGLGGFSPERALWDYTPRELLWERPMLDTEYSREWLTVLGHTPTRFYGEEYRGRILRTATFVNVDVGVAYGQPPCLLRLDDMKEFYYKA